MSKNENTRPAGGTAGAGRGTGQDRVNRVPVSDYIVFDSDRQQSRVQNFLGHGKNSAIPGRKLLELVGGKDLRTVSKAVECARRSGIPICATTSKDGPGYFIAQDMDELSGYIRSLDHRLKEIRFTRSHLSDTLERMSGQSTIGGW